MDERKPVQMVLDRNYTVRSTLGHMLTFVKDVPMNIPPVMVRTCAEIGARPVDDEVDAFEEPEEITLIQPVDPGHRLEDIAEAIEVLAERNNREDFTASGTPNVKGVTREVGYKVDRTEIMKVWRQRAEDLADAS